MPRTILATAFAVVVCLFPWIIGGNYPFVRTFASALIVLFLLITAINNWKNRKSDFRCSPHAQCVTWVLLAVMGYCGIQTFFPGQIFSSELPAASRERLSELSYGIGFFIFAYYFFRNSENIVPFAVAVFVNGVLLALFGVVQQLSFNGMLFWNYELVQGGIPFSSFVNRNNAAGYLVLCFAVANFFLARQLFRANSLRSGSGNPLRSRPFSDQLRTAVENIESSHLYLFSGLLLIAVSVFFSQSRGGVLALIAAFLIGWVIMLKTNRLLIVAMLVSVAAGAGFVVYSDQSRVITERMQTLADPELAGTPRLEHWSTVIPYISEYAMTGSGLGTYQYLYPQYQETQFKDWFRHAENQYLESLAEVGIFGIAALLALLFLLFRCCISKKADPTDRAVGIVGLMALIGQAVAGFFDFGLYLPANTVLMATIMGMVLARHCAYSTDSQSAKLPSSVSARPRVLTALASLLIAANIWGVYQLSAVDSRRLAAHCIRKFDPEAGDQQLQHCSKLLHYSLAVRPDDSEAHYQLGQLNILNYRLGATKKLLEQTALDQNDQAASQPITDAAFNEDIDLKNRIPMDVPDALAARGPVPTDMQSVDQIWQATSLSALNRATHFALRDASDESAYEELISATEIDYLRHAAESFHQSEKHCPFLYRSQFRLAQLAVIVDRNDSQARRIEAAISRCPLNPNLLYNAGLLEHHAGNSNAAAHYWREVMRLTRKYDPQIILYSRHELSMKEFFEIVLPQDPQFLVNLANKYFNAEQDRLPRQLLLNHTRRLLYSDARTLLQPDNQFLLASIESEFEDYGNANKHFRSALNARPSEVAWRLAFARSLFSQQSYSESSKNLKICLVQTNRSIAQTREIQKLLRRIEKEQLLVREARRQ